MCSSFVCLFFTPTCIVQQQQQHHQRRGKKSYTSQATTITPSTMTSIERTHTLSQSDMVRLSVYLLCVNEIFSILICLKTKMVVAPIMMMVHKTKQYSEQSRKRRRKYSHYLEWIFSRLFSSLLYFLCICAVLATIDYTLSISPIIYWSIVLSHFIAGVENFCNFLLLSNAYNLQHFSRASIRCALNVFQLHRW